MQIFVATLSFFAESAKNRRIIKTKVPFAIICSRSPQDVLFIHILKETKKTHSFNMESYSMVTLPSVFITYASLPLSVFRSYALLVLPLSISLFSPPLHLDLFANVQILKSI